MRDAYWQMGRAGSLMSITGPLSVDVAAQRVVDSTRRIIDDGKDPTILSTIAAAIKKQEPYEERNLWVRSATEFAAVARAALKTQGLLPYRSVRWVSLPLYSPIADTTLPQEVSAGSGRV